MASLLINCTSRLRLAAAKPNRCQIASLRFFASDRYLPLRNSHFQLSLPCFSFSRLQLCRLGSLQFRASQLFLRRTVDGDCRPTLCAPADRAAARNSVLGRNVLMGTQQTHAYQHQADCIQKSTNPPVLGPQCPGDSRLPPAGRLHPQI